LLVFIETPVTLLSIDDYFALTVRVSVAAMLHTSSGASPNATERLRMVGPLGLEPRTKGFTSAPPFPEGVDYLFTPVGCGTL